MTSISDTFHKLVQLCQMHKSTFCIWKGNELFVFVQDIKHIAVSAFLPNSYLSLCVSNHPAYSLHLFVSD
jgi:hypothetical protein